jgi:predicted transcriptional regulator
MTIREASEKLNAEILQNEFEDAALNGAYTSDLLSDVMAHAKDGGALITIQAHKNTVAVATLVNLSAVIVCNNRPVPDDMIEAARDEGVAILRTKENQYTVSGKLYALIGASK